MQLIIIQLIDFIRASNPSLSKIYRIIRKHLSPLHCDDSLKDIINPFNCLLKNANFSIKTSRLDYFEHSRLLCLQCCRVALTHRFFLWNLRWILGIVNLRYTSVRLLLMCSNLLQIITLIVVFCKLYAFRQNFDNFNILTESLI